MPGRSHFLSPPDRVGPLCAHTAALAVPVGVAQGSVMIWWTIGIAWLAGWLYYLAAFYGIGIRWNGFGWEPTRQQWFWAARWSAIWPLTMLHAALGRVLDALLGKK